MLEYCNKENVIGREQHYFDILKPEYNILKIAGSSIEFEHSKATETKISINNTGINNPFIGQRINIGKSLKSINRININSKVVGLGTKLKMSLITPGVNVKVFDKSNNLVNELSTITSIAKHFGVS